MFIKNCTEPALIIRPNFWLCLSVNKDKGLFTYSNSETPSASYPFCFLYSLFSEGMPGDSHHGALVDCEAKR